MCDASELGGDFALAEAVRLQSVVAVEGVVRRRSEETYNPAIATGTVELLASQIEVLSEAGHLPFLMEEGAAVREDLRLKYRYLDLRQPRMYHNLRFRYEVQRAAEDYLDAHGFLAVETPMLTKSTPEGARDYLVPSRVHPGSFYALPQSPQIFKQLLMVGGIDRYYQIARCFRDEDLRADRQPEFTQVDMEMSFVEQEDVLRHLERFVPPPDARGQGRGACGHFHASPGSRRWTGTARTSRTSAIDLRIRDLTDLAREGGFSLFRKVAESGGVVRAICCPGRRGLLAQRDRRPHRRGRCATARGGMAWYRAAGRTARSTPS